MRLMFPVHHRLNVIITALHSRKQEHDKEFVPFDVTFKDYLNVTSKGYRSWAKAEKQAGQPSETQALKP
jgi:hypothetical protein